jgi:hypothetical protein
LEDVVIAQWGDRSSINLPRVMPTSHRTILTRKDDFAG